MVDKVSHTIFLKSNFKVNVINLLQQHTQRETLGCNVLGLPDEYEF